MLNFATKIQKELVNILHYQIWIYTAHGKTKKSYKNESKRLGPTLDDKCEFHNRFYSVSDIQDYFDCVIEIHLTIASNPPIQIYINRNWKQLNLKLNQDIISNF